MPLLPEILHLYIEALAVGLLCGLILYASAFLPYVNSSDSFAWAVLFGLEPASSSILLSGRAAGCILNKALLFGKWISKICAGIFAVLGLGTLKNTIMVTCL